MHTMAVDHYENFPVASLLLPRELRAPVKHIYYFARSADDIADEGQALPNQRLAQLAGYRAALDQIENGELNLPAGDPRYPIFHPLAQTIQAFSLPIHAFRDLLSAFEQDVVMNRYPSGDALLDYCSRSANPVGLLMLHLYGAADPRNIADSNALCTGLQLVNFWQDVALDWRKNRIYIPLDMLAHHGVDEDDIAQGRWSTAWQAMMDELAGQARQLLRQGLELAWRLPGRIGLELRMVVHGGLRILERLERLHYDIFAKRPTLATMDWLLLTWRALSRPKPAATKTEPEPSHDPGRILSE